ncbi:MAG: MFS transporter [Patescibacteria group bacterium]
MLNLNLVQTLIYHRRLRRYTYASIFLLSVHLSFISYISSSFIAEAVGERYVGLVFSIGSALAIMTLLIIPTLMKTIGNVQITLTLAFSLLINILMLAYVTTPVIIISFFLLYYVTGLAVQYSIDLYLEKISDDSETGGIRGLFLSVLNLAIMLSLLTTGFILGDGSEYWKVFLFSGLVLLPFLYLAGNYLPEIPEQEIKEPIRWWSTIKKIAYPGSNDNPNLKHILAIDFLISFFYSLMVVYMPIYLNKYIGLNWSEIGMISAFMLLPFVLFAVPFGRIADNWLGEKEIMSAGLIIAGIATMIISFIDNSLLWFWGLLLFTTRLGISAIETMKESYLFKQIDGKDSNILSISRNIRSLAYLIGPLVATIFLHFNDYRYLFFFLGLVMIWGLRYCWALVDTK